MAVFPGLLGEEKGGQAAGSAGSDTRQQQRAYAVRRNGSVGRGQPVSGDVAVCCRFFLGGWGAAAVVHVFGGRCNFVGSDKRLNWQNKPFAQFCTR